MCPENAIVRYYQKTGRTTEKLWNIFGKFYRVNLEILGYPSRVSLPKNTPRVFGWVFFFVERVGPGTYKYVLGIRRAGTAKIPPGGWAGRVFLVPVSSLVSLAALGIFIFWSKQHLFRLTGIWPFLSNTSGLPDWIVFVGDGILFA